MIFLRCSEPDPPPGSIRKTSSSPSRNRHLPRALLFPEAPPHAVYYEQCGYPPGVDAWVGQYLELGKLTEINYIQVLKTGAR